MKKSEPISQEEYAEAIAEKVAQRMRELHTYPTMMVAAAIEAAKVDLRDDILELLRKWT